MLSLLFAMIGNYQKAPGAEILNNTFLALRQTLIDGQLTFVILIASFITLMIFLMFYFLANQNKKHFEEQFILISRMNARLKNLEKNVSR